MADSTPKSYHTDPQLYLYTSLTAGSSHIITATARLETILKANKIPFVALDVATDEKARMLWGRRAGKRRLPGLVRMGMIVGDLEEVEEWNEYGELRENVDPSAPAKSFAITPTPSATNTPLKAPSALSTTQNTTTKAPSSSINAPQDALAASPFQSPTKSSIPNSTSTSTGDPLTLAMRQAGFEAAKKAGDAKAKARTDALAVAQEKSEASEDLKKLDNSGPTGMPPPTGTTEAEDARAPDTAGAGIASNADEVPTTLEMKAEKAMTDSGEGATRSAGATTGDEDTFSKEPDKDEKRPSTHEFEGASEGTGQASLPPVSGIPTAQEAEAAANAAIMKDKSHIVLLGKKAAEGTPLSSTPRDEPVEYIAKETQKGEGAGGEHMKPTSLKEVSATDKAQDLTGTKTQEQGAGDGEKAGESVAD